MKTYPQYWLTYILNLFIGLYCIGIGDNLVGTLFILLSLGWLYLWIIRMKGNK